MRVLKIGGNELADRAFLRGLAIAVASLPGPTVLVHGGGQAIADLQQRLGLKVVKIDGLRVTDAESMQVVEMVLSGAINKLLVRALLAQGLDAIGLSGVDGGLLRCRPKQHETADLGFVGEIESVRAAWLRRLIDQGGLPVISPVSLSSDNQTYNINADEAAAAVAVALDAAQLDFISNVPGVVDTSQSDAVIPTLTVAETERLIAAGTIHGGMVPKVRAALHAVAQGVPRARVVNLEALATGGTTFVAA